MALEYHSCHLPGGPGGSPQCVRPWGCRPLRPVPLLPSVRVHVRVLAHLAPVHPCTRPLYFPVSAAKWLLFTGVCAVSGMCVLVVFLYPLLPPPFFVLYICFL